MNRDRKINGFKLAHLAVVLEPATWPMMIGGLAYLGTAIRGRGRRALPAA